MNKIKYSVEYDFKKASKSALWRSISTTEGLSRWFADDVSASGMDFTFTWNGESRDAKVTGIHDRKLVRFHWADDANESSYFEFKLHFNELVNEVSLEITDFAIPSEIEEEITLWDEAVSSLRKSSGV